MSFSARTFLCISLFFFPIGSFAQSTVTYENDLLTVICTDAPLSQVFEQISKLTGMELILEDSVKSKRLTASLENQPTALTIERLLEGKNVNYAVSLDLRNWQRVAKIFIGSGGGPVAQAQPAQSSRRPNRERPSRRPAPDPDNMDEPQDFIEGQPGENDPGAVSEPAPAPTPDTSIVPPAQSFPRSRFTPGLESSPFGPNTQAGRRSRINRQTSQPPTAGRPPPANFPFLDPFGRPIPVPPGTTQKQPKQEPPKNNL